MRLYVQESTINRRETADMWVASAGIGAIYVVILAIVVASVIQKLLARRGD